MHQQFLTTFLVTSYRCKSMELVVDNARTHSSKRRSSDSMTGLSRGNSNRRLDFFKGPSDRSLPPCPPRRGVGRSPSFDGEFSQQPRSSLHNVSRPRRRRSISEGYGAMLTTTRLLPDTTRHDKEADAAVPFNLNEVHKSFVVSMAHIPSNRDRGATTNTDRKARADFLVAALTETLNELSFPEEPSAGA